uniref:MYND-type domain-containing protein n=1 Tax=Zea mays TaxID=4577 RepID=B4FT88_MAIZE|nr:unknown [Zea mays]
MWLAMACLLRDQHEQWKHKYGNPCRSVKIFRCQLPRNNAFYSAQPPKHDGSDKPLCPGAPVCHWCGTWKGDKICSSCKKARYCYEKHQGFVWLPNGLLVLK